MVRTIQDSGITEKMTRELFSLVFSRILSNLPLIKGFSIKEYIDGIEITVDFNADTSKKGN